jgi:hypothetical protein
MRWFCLVFSFAAEVRLVPDMIGVGLVSFGWIPVPDTGSWKDQLLIIGSFLP